MITKEIIDNLSHEDTLLLLRTTSNDKVFYNDVIKGKTLIENIRFELNTDRVHFANGYKFLASYPCQLIVIYPTNKLHPRISD